MKTISTALLVLLAASCSGMKVQKGEPPPQSKPGVTWGGPAVGKITVQKVGFHCAVKGKILTFTNFGGTEAKATEDAMASCHKVHPNGPCTLESCKRAE